MKFYSLSRYPGTTGEKYYNTLFLNFGMLHTYIAMPCVDLKDSIQRLIQSGANGISISMPYKQEIINLLDHKDDTVTEYNSCNSVMVVNNKLHGYNFDIAGVEHVASLIETEVISILGDGAIGAMFKKYIPDATVYSRKNNNWDGRHMASGTIINCTPYGTSVPTSPFTLLPKCKMVIDMAVKENQLSMQCANDNVKYVPGIVFYQHQFIKQFQFYTGKEITIKDLETL